MFEPSKVFNTTEACSLAPPTSRMLQSRAPASIQWVLGTSSCEHSDGARTMWHLHVECCPQETPLGWPSSSSVSSSGRRHSTALGPRLALSWTGNPIHGLCRPQALPGLGCTERLAGASGTGQGPSCTARAGMAAINQHEGSGTCRSEAGSLLLAGGQSCRG